MSDQLEQDLKAVEAERGELHNRLAISQQYLLDLLHHGLAAFNTEKLFKTIQDNKPLVRKEFCPTCGYAVSSIFDHLDWECSPDMSIREIRRHEKESEESAKAEEKKHANG